MSSTAGDIVSGFGGEDGVRSSIRRGVHSATPSSGSASPDLLALEQARASYRDVLRRWGMRPTKNLLNLIDKAIQGRWGTTLFVDHLRHTPEYLQRFPGLRWQDGMTEGSYNAQYASYRAKAQDIGESFDRRDFAKILRRGVDQAEFSDRVDAISSIQRWGPMWDYFSEALKAQGIAKDVSKSELADFVMGLGSERWERLYEETFISAGLERIAGVTVGKPPEGWAVSDYAISRQDLLTLVKQVESLSPGTELEKLSGQDYARIGKELRQFSPTYLTRYGISTKDLLEMELGGPRAAAIATKAEKLLATQKAFDEPRALPQQAQAVGQSGTEEPQTL